MVDAPVPPLRLADRVCSLAGSDHPVEAYDRLGAEARAALLDLLPADWSFDGRRVLDFGCGAGRTLRHFLGEAQRAELWGADIDAPSVAWLKENLSPPLHVMQNGADPPLGLEHGTFDLIWALSVFTHLTDNSLPWLVELHRLLKPDGLLIATYMGRWTSEEFTHGQWDEGRIGMNVLQPERAWDLGGPTVLISDWWMRAHWGRAFDVLDVAPQVHGQSWALLRKLDVEVTAADLERLSDDPREYEALRHNVRQVERDRERALEEVRRYYEQSLSWRATRPLRSLKARLRQR